MAEVMSILVGMLMMVGSCFCLFAAMGVLRFPDLYSRMHAASKAGVFGSGLILVGLAIFSQDYSIITRAILGILFLILTTPISAHLLAKASHAAGYRMWEGSVCDEMKDTRVSQDQ